MSSLYQLKMQLKRDGYFHLHGEAFAKHLRLSSHNRQWARLAKSWNNMPRDRYLRGAGDYRYRRYNVFDWHNKKGQGRLQELPYEAHYQNSYRNKVNGGFMRNYAKWPVIISRNAAFRSLLQWLGQSLLARDDYRIQAHQFRITANPGQAGHPTPEGIHQDGANHILIMMMKRENISGGDSYVYDENQQLIHATTLLQPMDMLFIDDQKVWHDVNEIKCLDSKKRSYRDVMVLTFHRKRH